MTCIIMCDIEYRDLHSQGIGTEVQYIRTLSPEEECKLWETGVLVLPPWKAFSVWCFIITLVNVLHLGRRGTVTLGTIAVFTFRNPDCYTCVEHGSKNRSGGLSQLRMENKCVPCYAVPDKSPTCLVFLLDQCLNKLPQYAFEKDVLYYRSKPKTRLISAVLGLMLSQ